MSRWSGNETATRHHGFRFRLTRCCGNETATRRHDIDSFVAAPLVVQRATSRCARQRLRGRTPLPSASTFDDARRAAVEVSNAYVDSRYVEVAASRTNLPTPTRSIVRSYPATPPHPCRSGTATPQPVGAAERASAQAPRGQR
jgi:hypothetical protein